MPALDFTLRFDFLPRHDLTPKAFLDELYRIVSRHPSYNRKNEPDFTPATPWWEVARYLIETFVRLLPEGFGARLLYEEDRLLLRAHYAVTLDYDIYMIDVSFLPFLKRRYRALHDFVTGFLATLLRRSAIGDWSEYVKGGNFYDWIDEQLLNEPDDQLQLVLDYYTDETQAPARYLKLLNGKTPGTKELAARAGRLRLNSYPKPLRELAVTLSEYLPLLDAPGLSLSSNVHPVDEEYGYPVEPHEYISLVWTHPRYGDGDIMQESHYSHIESQGSEYGMRPIGKVIDCYADKPYRIGRQSGATQKLLQLLCELVRHSDAVKHHYGVLKNQNSQ